jgi:hypothetical protein
MSDILVIGDLSGAIEALFGARHGRRRFASNGATPPPGGARR